MSLASGEAAQVYVPASGTWTSMASPRNVHTATLLPNGTVLVAGESNSTLEVYTP
ncbi:hypothetical protein POL68_25100 [Stigmatella sp. ncwal1]|uniref:Uncharacterized protein n=1 Tax=Stigmatella ashevillensis TaxID=2995309 RepID=A0ABT5DE43_9BACT|nr:hypothetical protein [Stigmatella ashevillena]MDC0711771.1 hypothetical protein [Stigmatella ashevillena]